MATLVDSSVWIQHFRHGDPRLIAILESGEILMHSAVLGELSAGNLKNRSKTLGNLKLIPLVQEVPMQSLFDFMEKRRLFGKGLGWVDIQILGAAIMSDARLLTDDLRLRRAYAALT